VSTDKKLTNSYPQLLRSALMFIITQIALKVNEILVNNVLRKKHRKVLILQGFYDRV